MDTKAFGEKGLKQTCVSFVGDSQVEAGPGKILNPQSSSRDDPMHASAGEFSPASELGDWLMLTLFGFQSLLQKLVL